MKKWYSTINENFKASVEKFEDHYIRHYEDMYKVVTFDGVEYVAKDLFDIVSEMINNGYGTQDVILRKGNVDIDTLQNAFSDFYSLLENSSFENEEVAEHGYIDTDSVQDCFIGKEHYRNLGFFEEQKIEKLLWEVRTSVYMVSTKSELRCILDNIVSMDKYLDRINNYKPFSVNDKKIFNSQILLSRLKGLVSFALWKTEHHINRGVDL